MIWFVMLGLYFSCSSSGSAPQKSAASYTVDYEEDLSVHRTDFGLPSPEESSGDAERPVSNREPEQTITASNAITEELDELISEVSQQNKSVQTVQGFTIQVYSGSSREKARQVQRQVYHVVPDVEPELKYVQPNYKVQVGQFVERLEAQKTYSMLKKEFPSALIIPDRIQIK